MPGSSPASAVDPGVAVGEGTASAVEAADGSAVVAAVTVSLRSIVDVGGAFKNVETARRIVPAAVDGTTP